MSQRPEDEKASNNDADNAAAGRGHVLLTSYPAAEDLQRAVAVLAQGGIVAFPTETFYGLAVDPGNEQALQALFQLKDRPFEKPILVLIQQPQDLSALVSSIPPLYAPLMKTFWPGPLTLVFPASERVSAILTGGSKGIAVRISSHPVAMQLGRLWKKPFTATSANKSGMPAACTATEVRQIFGDTIDCILDGGPTRGGKGSTVVGIRQEKLHLIRDGALNFSLFNQRGQLPE